jgi:hypothetical protein
VQSLLDIGVALFDENACVLNICFDAVNHLALRVNNMRQVLENVIHIIDVRLKLVESLKTKLHPPNSRKNKPDAVREVPANCDDVVLGFGSAAKGPQLESAHELSTFRPHRLPFEFEPFLWMLRDAVQIGDDSGRPCTR